MLSAYVSGAKAGLLGHYEGRQLSRDEKEAAAEALSASADWDGLELAAAFDMLRMERVRRSLERAAGIDMLQMELIAQMISELAANEAELARRLREPPLPVLYRPAPPIIKRQQGRERQSHA